MTYYGRNGRAYVPDKQLGSGGEGAVYSLCGNDRSVLKLYHADKLNHCPDLQEKLQTMLDQPVDRYIGTVLSVAWPEDLAFDPAGRFVGYIMP